MSKVYIRDMLFVNTIEKRLGRNLTEEELNSDEALELRFPNGFREFVVIPRLLFPDDVMSTEAKIDLEYTEEHYRSSHDVSYFKWYNEDRQEPKNGTTKDRFTIAANTSY